MTTERDATLTVALAEYAHLREARRALGEQAAVRFNFFLVVASAGTAVSAALVGAGARDGGRLDAARVGAIVVIAALVLLLGVAVFARQVEFNGRSRRYAVAETTLRTYLSRHSPELAPYLLMPTLDDPGPFAAAPFRRHWARDAVGLAGTAGLVNSALLATGGGVAAGRAAPWWAAAGAGVLLLAGALALHVVYVRRRLAASVAQVGEVLGRRGLPVLPPPAAPPSRSLPVPAPAGGGSGR
ncbi:MAG TPA: hypothetical protein VFY17_03005, partial [Pilimelia sp.]|nr:hypothetical protein [Pilimelia sp.]